MSGISIVADSATQFETGAAEYNSSCRLDDNTFVVAFRDNNDFNFGKAVVGTRAGTTIDVDEGNTATFESSDVEAITVRPLSTTKVVITYYDLTDDLTKAIVGTISGTAITFGTAVDMGDGQDGWPSLAVLDESNIVISIADGGSDRIEAYVASISGTVITVGTVQTDSNFQMSSNRIASVGLDSTHFAVAYNQSTDNIETSVGAVNIAAKTITFGAERTLNPAAPGEGQMFMDKFDSTHFIVGFVQNDSSNTELKLVALTYDISTLVITAGTAITTGSTATAKGNYSLCTMGAYNFLVAWYTTDGTQGEIRSGTLTGSVDIAWDVQGPAVFDTSTSAYTTLCRLTDNYFLLGYKRG